MVKSVKSQFFPGYPKIPWMMIIHIISSMKNSYDHGHSAPRFLVMKSPPFIINSYQKTMNRIIPVFKLHFDHHLSPFWPRTSPFFFVARGIRRSSSTRCRSSIVPRRRCCHCRGSTFKRSSWPKIWPRRTGMARWRR